MEKIDKKSKRASDRGAAGPEQKIGTRERTYQYSFF